MPGKGQARIPVLLLCATCLGAYEVVTWPAPAPPETQAVLDHISADSLRGHLSFIASDLLEGRATPSRGLETAAEYIAAQFRRAALEPVGDEGYFQSAHLLSIEPKMESFEMTLHRGDQAVSVNKEDAGLEVFTALNLSQAPVFKLPLEDPSAVASLKPEQVEGKVVVTELPDFRGPAAEIQKFQARTKALKQLKPALVVLFDRYGVRERGTGKILVDPETRSADGSPQIILRGPAAWKWYESVKAGLADWTVSLRLAAPAEKPVKLHNVIGLLRGSDPVLKDTYVLVTAHYDHIGMKPDGEGDRIYNGANDDGSGTVSVIELASALAAAKVAPRRSLVFMTFFGEEAGELGSRYYTRHPIFPIAHTVADLNLEHLGRTDSSEGPQLSNATFTGFDYSDLPLTFQAAGKRTGVRVYRHETNSEPYFSQSDNQPFADQGVPAHSVCVSFQFPDYHGVGDEWQKIDYNNMARVDRMLALGLLMLANNPAPPKWNEANPKTEPYVRAGKDQRK